MAVYEYKTIIERANQCKKSVEKDYKLGVNERWGYYFAKSILQPNKSFTQISFREAPKSTGDNLSRQIIKKDYISMAERMIKFVEENKSLPNYITCNGKKVKVNDYVYMFARILIYLHDKKAYPNYVTVNSKAFTKPTETTNEVFEYFKDVFGSVSTIDGALGKVAGKGYGYYYDDRYSNAESIRRMKQGKGVNCTDSCHVFFNIAKALGYEVHCLHIQCRGGDGHVRLKLRHKKHTDNTWIYRDPASVLNGGGVTSNWCMNGTQKAIDPAWFMANLNR